MLIQSPADIGATIRDRRKRLKLHQSGTGQAHWRVIEIEHGRPRAELALLLSWPDAPFVLRTSGEIDAYPENAKIWGIQEKELDPDDGGENFPDEEVDASQL
ncbi:hypothetical protein [Bradyrhizobium murdochi]|uniref:hypothetical protein n=1 Tax=Bradyrhizobium murdochi TaxID=1038859 RepID=UPI0006876180|nr:hypothetical protein [Bradyrhizobium murdochi]